MNASLRGSAAFGQVPRKHAINITRTFSESESMNSTSLRRELDANQAYATTRLCGLASSSSPRAVAAEGEAQGDSGRSDRNLRFRSCVCVWLLKGARRCSSHRQGCAIVSACACPALHGNFVGPLSLTRELRDPEATIMYSGFAAPAGIENSLHS
jgi:hypothetical protein